jgi:hypothetical protein
MAEDEYRQEFPSSAGAAVWGPDLATLRADVEDARGADVRRTDREAVARYLLGAEQEDAMAGFTTAVRAVLDARCHIDEERLPAEGLGSRAADRPEPQSLVARP